MLPTDATRVAHRDPGAPVLGARRDHGRR